MTEFEQLTSRGWWLSYDKKTAYILARDIISRSSNRVVKSMSIKEAIKEVFRAAKGTKK